MANALVISVCAKVIGLLKIVQFTRVRIVVVLMRGAAFAPRNIAGVKMYVVYCLLFINDQFQCNCRFSCIFDKFRFIPQGYAGKSCSLHIENNVGNEWHYLASAYSGLTARAAHSAIYVRETDSLYVYGGHDLNNVLGALQVSIAYFMVLLCD